LNISCNTKEELIMEQNNKEYLTKDLGEAAALVAEGVKLHRLEKDSSFCWFVFEKNNSEETSNKYWSGNLLVDAKKYNDSLRTLKDRLFAQK
jgi:hypothetical protein